MAMQVQASGAQLLQEELKRSFNLHGFRMTDFERLSRNGDTTALCQLLLGYQPANAQLARAHLMSTTCAQLRARGLVVPIVLINTVLSDIDDQPGRRWQLVQQ